MLACQQKSAGILKVSGARKVVPSRTADEQINGWTRPPEASMLAEEQAMNGNSILFAVGAGYVDAKADSPGDRSRRLESVRTRRRASIWIWGCSASAWPQRRASLTPPPNRAARIAEGYGGNGANEDARATMRGFGQGAARIPGSPGQLNRRERSSAVKLWRTPRSAEIMASARSRLVFCSSRIFSSTVSLAMSR